MKNAQSFPHAGLNEMTSTTAKPIDLEIISAPSAPLREISLTSRSARIAAYHTGCKNSAVSQAIYAVLCGLELNAVKAELPHGKFIQWREQNHADISKSTAANYMNLATAIAAQNKTLSKYAAMGQSGSDPLQLTNGELPADDQSAVLSAIKSITKGSLLTELFREFGILRAPTRQKYTAPKDQSPEEKAAAETQQALDHIDTLCADLEYITLDLLALVPKPKRQQLHDALVDKSKLIRSLTKKASETKTEKAARKKLAEASRQKWKKATGH